MSKVINKIKRRGNTHLITRFIYELHEYDMRTKDVLFIMTSCGYMSWEDFCKVARHDYYNSGYGSMEVAVDLKIFTTKGYFYRHEICDGMEEWRFHYTGHEMSNHRLDTKDVKSFVGGHWSTLSEIIKRGNKEDV